MPAPTGPFSIACELTSYHSPLKSHHSHHSSLKAVPQVSEVCSTTNFFFPVSVVTTEYLRWGNLKRREVFLADSYGSQKVSKPEQPHLVRTLGWYHSKAEEQKGKQMCAEKTGGAGLTFQQLNMAVTYPEPQERYQFLSKS